MRATISGKARDFESQLFFSDSLSDTILSASPYNTRGTRNTRNADDDIYAKSKGQTLLPLSGSNSAGYSGTFNMALSVS